MQQKQYQYILPAHMNPSKSHHSTRTRKRNNNKQQHSFIDERKITLRKIVSDIFRDNDNTFLNRWLDWPPDMFALTALVLQRTGCYKICLIDPWWQEPDWQDKVLNEAKGWVTHISSLLSGRGLSFAEHLKSSNGNEFPLIKEALATLERCKDNDIDLLRTLSSSRILFKDEEHTGLLLSFARALVIIHVIADMAFEGVGLVERPFPEEREIKLVQCLGNLLLTATGSISTIPKFHGIVLPKMRTPQVGYTIRSLSFHMTFHTSEVEVMWRTIPWMSQRHKSLNILAIPFPWEVKDQDFEVQDEQYHSVNYFSIKSQHPRLNFIESIIEAMKKNANIVDIIVLPEMALMKEEYDYLLYLLTKEHEE